MTQTNNKPPQLTDEQQARAVAAYRQSGDAAHAMRAAGIELGVPWVEQKRNSQGMVEILATDLFGQDPGGELSPMEMVESVARDNGLYEDVQAEQPDSVENSAELSESANDLLAIARERIPSGQFGIFLLVAVDGQPIRKVAEEYSISYREVRQTVDFVRNSLRRIAAEEGQMSE